MAGKELKGREKVVSKMTRDGLTEENLADGSVKDISHKSRGRPPEMKQDFVLTGKEESPAVGWTRRGTESAKKADPKILFAKRSNI